MAIIGVILVLLTASFSVGCLSNSQTTPGDISEVNVFIYFHRGVNTQAPINTTIWKGEVYTAYQPINVSAGIGWTAPGDWSNISWKDATPIWPPSTSMVNIYRGTGPNCSHAYEHSFPQEYLGYPHLSEYGGSYKEKFYVHVVINKMLDDGQNFSVSIQKLDGEVLASDSTTSIHDPIELYWSEN